VIVCCLCLSLAGCSGEMEATDTSTSSATPVATSAATPPSDPRIVGSWSSVGGPYAATYEYRADGMSLQHVGGTTRGPFPYRIDGDSIIVTATMPSGKVLGERTRFTLADDTLTFFDSDGEDRVFQRTPQ
jgi:hypothetical protein